MPSELYNSIGNKENNQNPKEAAMSRLKECGFNIPKEIENDPQAILQHIMQSGRVPQNRLSMAMQRMRGMFRR